jgi:hypothetical protein
MAKVHFAPFSAIKYIGSKAKVFNTSLARPKPTLKRGDIVIVDKKTAFNLVHKGFGEFADVTEIEFVKGDAQAAQDMEAMAEKCKAFEDENNSLFSRLADATGEITKLKEELLLALSPLADEDTLLDDVEPQEKK